VSTTVGTGCQVRKVTVVLLIAAVAAGCGPKRMPEESAGCGAPQGLAVQPGNGSMTVTWERHGCRIIAGHNVYISREPLVQSYPGTVMPESVRPFNVEPYPGDTNPDDGIEHFMAEGLENGVKYYVSVRIVFPDRSLSRPSREVATVCGPRGEIELSVRFSSESDGYSFEKDAYVRADSPDNDVYYFVKDGIDYLASPNRLGGFLRTNNLVVLPFQGELADISPKIAALGPILSGDRVIIRQGDWVLVRTPENRNALVHVLGFRGENKERRARLFFAYSTLTDGEMLF